MNKFKKIYLENKIPLYLCIDPSMKNVFVSYNVKYGSSGYWFNFNNNGADYNVISGYAHFLEHLLGEHSVFGNTYDNLNKRMHRANAYTADNVTSYHFQGSGDIEKSLKELIFSLECPVFDDKGVDETRQAIIEEAATSVDEVGVQLVNMVDNNLYSGFNKFDETLSPIGNRETTKQITTGALYDCYNAFYTDDNKFIIIAGNVEEEKIVDLLNNIYSTITPHKSNLILPDIDLTNIKTKNDVIYKNTETEMCSLGIKVKKPDEFTMKQLYYCMNLYLRYIMNSKEFNDMNKKGIINSLEYSYFTNIRNYINLIQSYSTDKKEKCFDMLLELISKKDITKEQYELEQKGIIASNIRKMDDKYNYLKKCPQNIYYTEEYSDIDFYKSINYDDYMNMISELDFSNYTTGELRRLK